MSMRLAIGLACLLTACGSPPPHEPAPAPPPAPPAEEAAPPEASDVANACSDRTGIRADLSERDDGHSIDLHTGDRMCIQLPSRRDLGYAWAFSDRSAGSLELVGLPGFAPGAGGDSESWGMESWLLRAVKEGTTTLRFEYMHASDEPIPAERVVSFSITIR